MGNLQDFEADRLQFLTDLRDRYGPVASFDARTTVVSDALVADEVLRDPTGSFEIRENFLGQHLGAIDLDELLQVRPLLNPGLRQSESTRLMPAIFDQTVRTLHGTDDVGCLPSAIDPLLLGEAVIAQVVGRHYFGADSEAVAPKVAALLDALEAVVGNVFALPRSWQSPAQRLIQRRYRELRTHVGHLIENRTAPSAGAGATSDLCTAVVAAGTGLHSTDRLADLLIGSLLAAQRVPAAAIAWILLLVAQHPGLQDQLAHEARRFADDLDNDNPRKPAAYHLAFSTVLEALRLYPPTWLLSRTATSDLELAGFQFQAGHVFLISPYVLHRDESHFPNAAMFDPTRWLSGAPPAKVYLPFGRGRHRCPGSDLATTCLVSILLTIVERARIEHAGPVRRDVRTTLKPEGVRLHLTSRRQTRVEA